MNPKIWLPVVLAGIAVSLSSAIHSLDGGTVVIGAVVGLVLAAMVGSTSGRHTALVKVVRRRRQTTPDACISVRLAHVFPSSWRTFRQNPGLAGRYLGSAYRGTHSGRQTRPGTDIGAASMMPPVLLSPAPRRVVQRSAWRCAPMPLPQVAALTV